MAGQHQGFTSSVPPPLLPRFIWEGSCWQISRGVTTKGQVGGQRELLAFRGLQFPIFLLTLSWQRNHSTSRLLLLCSEFDYNRTGNFSKKTKTPHPCQKPKSGSAKRFCILFCSSHKVGAWAGSSMLAGGGSSSKVRTLLIVNILIEYSFFFFFFPFFPLCVWSKSSGNWELQRASRLMEVNRRVLCPRRPSRTAAEPGVALHHISVSGP